MQVKLNDMYKDRLQVNISDMLASRKKSCEALNRRFGTNWNVRLNPEWNTAKK